MMKNLFVTQSTIAPAQSLTIYSIAAQWKHRWRLIFNYLKRRKTTVTNLFYMCFSIQYPNMKCIGCMTLRLFPFDRRRSYASECCKTLENLMINTHTQRSRTATTFQFRLNCNRYTCVCFWTIWSFDIANRSINFVMRCFVSIGLR